MKKTNLLAVLTLAATPAFLHAQTTSYSDVVGYNTLSFPAGNSTHAATFVKGNVFQGVASSKTVDTLTIPSSSLGALGPSSGLPTHYVKITSGAMEGYVFDVLSSTATSITIDGDLTPAEATPSFVVRAHVKASELFAGNTSLSPGLDTVTVFNPDSTSTVLLWVGTDSATGWVDPVTEAVVDAVIYPGQGFVLTTVGSGNYRFQGTVENTPTVVPIFPGAVNLVTLASPGGGTKALQTSGLGANMASGLDTVEFWSQDGSLSSTEVYLWAGADGFVNVVTEAPATKDVGSSEVMNVTVVNPTTWKAPSPLTP